MFIVEERALITTFYLMRAGDVITFHRNDGFRKEYIKVKYDYCYIYMDVDEHIAYRSPMLIDKVLTDYQFDFYTCECGQESTINEINEICERRCDND